jgi:hypothetical protein
MKAWPRFNQDMVDIRDVLEAGGRRDVCKVRARSAAALGSVKAKSRASLAVA